MSTHAYQATYESRSGDIVTGSVEVRFTYTYDPEAAEDIELTEVEVEGSCGKWREPSDDERVTFSEWAEDRLFDDMRDHAIDQIGRDADPCTIDARRAGCTCTLSSVNSATIDPPHEIIDRACPLHGNAPDPDHALDLKRENDRLDRIFGKEFFDE